MVKHHEPSIGVFKNTFRRVDASYETIGIPEPLDKTILSGQFDSNPCLSAIGDRMIKDLCQGVWQSAGMQS